MELRLRSARRSVVEIPAPVRIVGIWGGELSDEGQRLDEHLKGKLSAILKNLRFQGDLGETLLLPMEEFHVLLVGLGKRRGISLEALRRVGAKLVGEVARLGFREAACETFLSEKLGKKEASAALTEGMVLGSYEFLKYKSRSEAKRLRLWLSRASSSAVERALIVAEAVCFARDLVNEPPNVLYPAELARRAEELAQLGLEVEVWEPERIREVGMGLFLGVAQGSAQPPRFIQVRYRPTGKPQRVLALIGKGLTFDTGGYSLKTSEGMSTMKSDMSGAAAVLGAMRAIAQLRPPVEVWAYIAAAENMVSGSAYRLQDVLKSLSGKTVEVLNTDAEGRLTLADAITFADREGAQTIVELSTLTGACVVALGNQVAGLFSNDARLAREIEEAAERAGEKVWPLPLEEEYRERLKSSVADLKNVAGGRDAGAIIAALFLSEFTEKPLAHLDIAGPAFSDKPHALGPAGGTGYGVRLLVELVDHLQS